MGNNCLIMTPSLRKQYEEIWRKYPDECKRIGLTEGVYLSWVESYQNENNKPSDFVPETEALINLVEKNKNKDGKSFRHTPYSAVLAFSKSTFEAKQKAETTIVNSNAALEWDSSTFLPGSETKINIYAGTGENAELSNFAIRPFRHQFGSIGAYKDFQSVEQAFQYIKAHQFADTRANDGIARDGKSIETEIMETTNGAELRKLGRSVKELNVQAWDRAASAIMKGLLKESFEQNPQALQRLLSTGNATLTHTQDKGKWGTEFPKLLMEVREELRKSNPQAGNNSFPVGELNIPSVGAKEQLINHLRSIGINVFDRAQMEKYLKEHPNTLLQQALEEQWEMQNIKAKAIADGTFMKAPNGKPTNLDERQWLQVRTKNFINWFGDWINDPANASKVIDENGEPKVVYHGSKTIINVFDASKSKVRQRVSEIINPTNFFSSDKSVADFFAVTEKQSKAKTIGSTLNDILESHQDDDPDVVWNWVAEEVKMPVEEVKKFWLEDLIDEERWDAEIGIYDPEVEKQKYSVFLNMRNPIIIDAKGERADKVLEENNEKIDNNDEVIIVNIDETVGNNVTATDYLVRKPNNIKSATDNNGMFSTESDDIQMAIGNGKPFGDNNSYKNKKKSTKKQRDEIINTIIHNKYETIGTDIIKIGNSIFLFDHTDRDDLYKSYWDAKKGEIPDGIGYGIRKKYNFAKLINEDLYEITTNIAVSYNSDETSIRNRLQELGIKSGNLLGIDFAAAIREGNRDDGLGIGKGGGGRNQIVKDSSDAASREYKGEEHFFITPERIYGFVDKDGNIYLDETAIDASHPIHEYTHLWDRALAKINPELWKKGVNLMQEGVPGLWNEIANSDNYGKLWQTKGIKGEKLINLIASEVHSRLVGDNGAKLLEDIAKKRGEEGIIAKLKQWILDAWKELKATFSNWSQEEIDKLTLKDFNHMTVRDFADGINPNTVSSPSNAAPETATNVNKEEAKRPKSVAYESALVTNESRMAKFKRAFSSQQIKDRGAMISNMFSRIIDTHLYDLIDVQLSIIEDENKPYKEREEARIVLNKLRDPVSGRQYAAEDKQLPVILNEIKQELEWDLDAAPEEQKQLWQNTIEYFDDLVNTQASLDIEEREGIRIVGLKFVEQTVTDDENDALNDGDDEVGHVVSGSDGWNFQVRYTNPFDSLSRKVRSMLYEIERPESEKDDLGQIRYYPMGRIYASLLAYLAKHMQDSDVFLNIDKSFEGQDRWGNDITETSYPNGYPSFPVLEEMKITYPWVQQIIDRLTDDYLSPDWNTNLRYPSTGGSMSSQFYTNFRKVYIPYGKIQLGGKNFSVTPLNYEMEERAQYDKLVANYNNRMILSEHSIYNSGGKINKKNAQWLKKQLESTILDMERINYSEMPELIQLHQQNPNDDSISQEDIQEFDDFIDNVKMLLQSFGIDATQDSVAAYLMMDNGKVLRDMLGDLGWVATTIMKVADEKVDSYNYIIDTKDRYDSKLWTHFFYNRGLITDASYMQSFYDSASKKTKYSYSADNYLMKTFRGVCMGTQNERRKFIEEHFGKFEWFKNQNTKEWRNKWLEYWCNYEGEQKEIPYRNIDNVTEVVGNEVRIRQYMKWEPNDIWQVQNRSYDPEKESKDAFYLAPIFSDSPMSMTVKGPKMSMEQLLYGYDENGQHKQGALVHLVNQELWRIGYVQNRAQAIKEGKVKSIANFDDTIKAAGYSGTRFCFLPELNNYVFKDTGETFLGRMTRLKSEKATMAAIESSEIQAIHDIIGAKQDQYISENWQDEYQYDNETFDEVKARTQQQYYNMVYANAAIIQLTTVDLAFYKDDTDFQKRFKEVYAGGIQLNTNSKYGEKTENIILLSDDIITSPSYDKIAAIIDGSSLSTEDKSRIKATFTDINVADAQAFRSMHSFRSILDMMGNWTDEMENALNHFKQGEWRAEDFDIIYQTIKPFVYSVIERNDGFGSSILVPQQNKNSEICALMMYDLITNGLDDSPVYKALSRFMDDNTDADGNHLIDMIQYESAGKVGNQGVINISINSKKVISAIEEEKYTPAYVYEKDDNGNEKFLYYLPNDEKHAVLNYNGERDENGRPIKGTIKSQLDDKLTDGKITQEAYNKNIQELRPTEDEIISMLEQAALVTNPDGTKSINPEIVHTIPFDNYYQQQPTPEHHIDAEATFGSQTRNIVVADLPDDFEMTIKVKGGKHTFKGKDAVIDFYYELLNENLIEDFFGKGNKKGLKGIFSSKEALRDAVTDIVRGNPKYGRDFADALQLDENGNFVLSPNSPTIFNLMQEIVTSFFKNRITKQTINGAALIQAAGIGLDDSLMLEFDDNGNLLGAHCLMPLTSKKFFEPLLETQVINGKEVKVLSPEKLKKAGLDKAIGYRIPTENKSSIMPLIIDGFTPLQNGSAIVLPAEITNIAGSDFDVDKMFIMLLSFYVQNYNMRKAREDYAKANPAFSEAIRLLSNNNMLDEDELEGVDNEAFNKWFKENRDNYELDEPIIRRIEYDFNKTPKENGRKARNNMIIQMMYGILTSKAGSESVMNPQGFPDVKYAAKVTKILTDSTLRNQLFINTNEAGPGVLPSSDQIIAEFLDILQNKYADRPDLIDQYRKDLRSMSDMQIQEAYIQAVTAGNKPDSIKILMDSSTKDLERFIKKYSAPESPVYPQTFAHSHAKNMAGAIQIGIYAIQGSMAAKFQRATERLREEQQFTINGRRIINVDVPEEGKRLKNVGQMIGASADNGKDPNLSDMGSTSKTASIIGYMLRAGLSHLEASLIINQRHMQNSNFKSQKGWNKGGYFGTILGRNPLATPVGNVTTDMLIRSIISPFDITNEENKAIAGLCYRILLQNEAQEYMTQISRADSPNGAMQNSYAKGRIQRYKVDLFQAKMGQDDFPFVRINDALSNTAINTTASEDEIREQLKGQRMAFLHGMYALGINSFNGLVNPYFFGAQKWFDDEIVKPILYNIRESDSDDKKEKIVNNIYTSYITYMLSDSPLFGNDEGHTMKEKRNRYLNDFPNEYQKIIQENEDIRDLLGSILQVKQFESRKRIILQDVGSLSKGQKQDVQTRFESLLYMNDPETAKIAEKLAKDLFIYSYFDNGLQFTHDSFSHLFTTLFLTNFPMYNETLLKLDERISDEEEENFIYQFLLTYPEATYKIDDIIRKEDANNGIIKITLSDAYLWRNGKNMMINELMSPEPQFKGINVYPYVSYNEDIYVLDKDKFEQYPGTPTYHKLEKYQTFSRLPLFSKQMSVAQMAQEFPVSDDNQQEGQYTAPEDLGAPMAHNEGEGDPNVGPDSLYDIYTVDDESIPNFDSNYWSDIDGSTPTDTYQSEGEGELESPFC